MQPISIANNICRYYTQDRAEVDPALRNLVLGKLRARDYAGLSSCSSHFDLASHTVDDFKYLRQVQAFYSKNANLADDGICTDAARLNFFEAEEACSKTNIRLRPYVGNLGLIPDPTIQKYVRRMRTYITNVLGDFSCFLDELPYLVKVTPGATSHSSRKESLPQLKLKMRLFATPRAHKYLFALYRFYGFRDPRLKPTNTNRVELVPKNWKTHRTIACEAEGNIPLQLAFDTYAKRRLRRYGINLRDQSCNQRAARAGSSGASNDATVDFSKASDTISYNTVCLVFPDEWLKYLIDVRTPGYRGVFGRGVYSKFSSMGNGSTFTIETLLFAAACYAVGAKGFLVYGDDVVIDSSYFPQFLELTRFLGFTINTEKSFITGPFRESCGLDVYNGRDVTPVYIRAIDRRKANLCHLINTMASLTDPDGHLEDYLGTIVKEYNLPFVPYQESTIAGVWIDPVLARTLGILFRYPFVKPVPKFIRLRATPETRKTKRFKKLQKRIISGHASRHVDYCRSYVAKTHRRSFINSRGYYLWFLNKNSQVLFSEPWDVYTFKGRGFSVKKQTESSTAPVYDHSYVRKRVCWVEPAEGIPGHLYWWSEHIRTRVSNPPSV